MHFKRVPPESEIENVDEFDVEEAVLDDSIFEPDVLNESDSDSDSYDSYFGADSEDDIELCESDDKDLDDSRRDYKENESLVTAFNSNASSTASGIGEILVPASSETVCAKCKSDASHLDEIKEQNETLEKENAFLRRENEIFKTEHSEGMNREIADMLAEFETEINGLKLPEGNADPEPHDRNRILKREKILLSWLNKVRQVEFNERMKVKFARVFSEIGSLITELADAPRMDEHSLEVATEFINQLKSAILTVRNNPYAASLPILSQGSETQSSINSMPNSTPIQENIITGNRVNRVIVVDEYDALLGQYMDL